MLTKCTDPPSSNTVHFKVNLMCVSKGGTEKDEHCGLVTTFKYKEEDKK